MKLLLTKLCIFGVFLISGCSSVEPWERGNLAKPEMQIGSDPVDDLLLEQVFYSKEASSGGVGAAGGGCGCN
ncbi:MAG: DUF4266 domain-containing protein [Pseudomonadota bacterium]|jgi:hypothetical protein|nr:DUF4266 domain-containing protein [Pseudomonadota bacterium]